jgi:hypothetical protein
MPVEMKMWRIDGDEPKPLSTSVLPAERDLHEFLKLDPSLLGERLLVIGSEVTTPYGPRLDLLAIDADGNLHLLELKRAKTPREVVAQVLDYGSWASTLSRDDIIDIASKHLDQPFEAAFEDVFGAAPPDELNGELSLTIVAADLDASSERIVGYLRGFGVPVNAVFFSYLEDDGRRYLARSWLTASDDETPTATTGSKKSKRAPWNGKDWYISFGGGDRVWDDARQLGFVSGGGGKMWSQDMRSLPKDARIWVNVPPMRYVAVGRVLAPASRFEAAQVRIGSNWMPLATQELRGTYSGDPGTVDDNAEWVVPVEWIDARALEAGFWEKGMFASQHSACKLRQEFTLERLAAHFGLTGDEA